MIVALFPGQGIPARVVLDALPERDPMLANASQVLGYDVRRKVEIAARRKGAMLPTSLAQPAIFTASLIGFWHADSEGRTYDFFVGHSLGEYAALVAARALRFDDALGCVAARADAMQVASRAAHGGMAAVLGLDHALALEIAESCGVTMANDNAPDQTVIAGDDKRLGEAAALVRARGGRSVLLEVSGPFHTPAMASAAPMLRRALDGIEFSRPKVPVISNVTARPHEGPETIADLLVQQLSAPVRFRESLEWVWESGVREYEDLGPGRIAAGLAQRCFSVLEAQGVGAHA